ncbi:molybdopterin synthase catalytic subunit [Lingula anatina]|uniref:Molybdopterin synthase catalytic subunit n=1 Tax=Lingula anatina TaxID=7574 RepID=A0A1S3JTT6_LINAN|nr:molybdopterin synthase catalytic subunit [Lingula anatina]|eukprot:XP_013413479.1 molybdopterin synthase catalytic subunit [Lingula anatina]
MSDHLKVTDDRLSVEEITEIVTSPSSGAVSVFIGTTRDNFNGKKVNRLEYEAYIPMAESEMKKICKQIREKWPEVENIGMHHRLGYVPIKDASVIIAVSSPHRKDAIEATQFGIDTFKATVPIWKKEYYEDDSSVWKENKECCFASNQS